MSGSTDDIVGLILPPNEADQMDGQLMADYMSQLSSLGVRALTGEPHRLADTRAAAIDRTQQLAYNHYKTFISNADSTQRVTNDFYATEHTVDAVLAAVPRLVTECQQFSAAAKAICDRWRDVSQMLANHPQILEVLEIPQLMDTCVRTNYYEEALQLYAHVQTLAKRHGESVPIISSIAKDVDVFREIMIAQLLKDLSVNIQFQNCLKIIGYLRRTDKFTETELRIKFLTARDQWLSSMIKEIPANNPLIHITKVIETNRVNLFDIITQYRAIFADTDQIVPQHYTYYGLTTQSTGGGGGRDFTDGAIINSWVLFKVNQFLDTLRADVKRCVNNEFGHYYPIESIVEPVFYFGLSMSRIGADFRPQLIPIINDAIADRFARVVADATHKFETSIQSFTLTSHAINTSAAASLLVGAATDDQSEDDLIPPTSLLEFPLLAYYCNDILSAMNEIRRTTPLATIGPLTNALNDSFQRVSNAITKYFRAEESGLSGSEREILYRFCSQYAGELLPHLGRCFDRILPMSSVANRLGVSAIEFAKVKDQFPRVRVDTIADSVNRLLPNTALTAGDPTSTTTTTGAIVLTLSETTIG